jgi:hypothetical protein
MARLKGIIRMDGGRGSFYQDKIHGDMIRQKGGPSRQQIKMLDSCEVVRQTNSAFGNASRAGKQFRESFYQLLHQGSDHLFRYRVQTKMMEAIKRDSIHLAGSRTPLKENFQTFGWLELRADFKAGDYFHFPIERALRGNELTIDKKVTAKVPSEKAATHFKVVSVAVYIDFKTGKHVQDAFLLNVSLFQNKRLCILLTGLKARGFFFMGCVWPVTKGEFGVYLLNKAGLNRGFIEWVAKWISNLIREGSFKFDFILCCIEYRSGDSFFNQWVLRWVNLVDVVNFRIFGQL